jgi:hypothetical protein
VTSRVTLAQSRADLGEDTNARADAIIARILAENGATQKSAVGAARDK